jgi:hypothetical protein
MALMSLYNIDRSSHYFLEEKASKSNLFIFIGNIISRENVSFVESVFKT